MQILNFGFTFGFVFDFAERFMDASTRRRS
jgi:hypothetical protein